MPDTWKQNVSNDPSYVVAPAEGRRRKTAFGRKIKIVVEDRPLIREEIA
jgi:hypothetical protein